MLQKKDKYITTVIVVVSIIIVLFLALYFCTFHGPLSNTSADWGHFGEYFGAVCSVVLSIAVFVYTYFENQSAKEEKQQEKINKLLEKTSTTIVKVKEWKSKKSEINEHDDAYTRGLPEFKSKRRYVSDLETEIMVNYKIIQTLYKNVYGCEINKTEADTVENIEDIINRIHKEI